VIARWIDWCAKNRFLVFTGTLLLVLAGIWSLRRIPLDALPDISDVQVIIHTRWAGQPPSLIEDQVTYPIVTKLLAAPHVKAVRAQTMLGDSYVFVVFEDGTDLYWARSRVLEYMQQIEGGLPANVHPVIGPDATGAGWIYEYVLEDRTHGRSLAELRSIQDWYLRYQLETMKLEGRLPEILEEVAQVRRDLGYPIVVSPFAQYVVTQATLNVVQGERYKTIPDEIRKYASGYYGKLAAKPSDEFLERANLKADEFVTERPGEHIEPWIPRLRAELGAQANDEDLLLAAFYDKALLEPLKKPAPAYRYGTTPLHELVSWLGARRDIEYAHIRFAGTEMTFSA